MDEGVVSIVLAIIALLGVFITSWFTYKAFQRSADKEETERLRQRIIALEEENKRLMGLIIECAETKMDK